MRKVAFPRQYINVVGLLSSRNFSILVSGEENRPAHPQRTLSVSISVTHCIELSPFTHSSHPLPTKVTNHSSQKVYKLSSFPRKCNSLSGRKGRKWGESRRLPVLMKWPTIFKKSSRQTFYPLKTTKELQHSENFVFKLPLSYICYIGLFVGEGLGNIALHWWVWKNFIPFPLFLFVSLSILPHSRFSSQRGKANNSIRVSPYNTNITERKQIYLKIFH